MPEVIKSISYSQEEILQSIMTLYLGGEAFELDPTYSKGNFYKKIPKPKYKFDIAPQDKDTIKASSDKLPLESRSIKSICFDPPFCFYSHGKTKENKMVKRFTMFDTFAELELCYKNSLKEFYRILGKNSLLVFKCQDYTDQKTVMTHCLVYNWACEIGFYAKDLFILLAKQRIYNPNLQQRHARKFHSYFWCFIKK